MIKNTHALKIPNKNQTFDQKKEKKMKFDIVSFDMFSSVILFDVERNSGHLAIVENPAKKSIQENKNALHE